VASALLSVDRLLVGVGVLLGGPHAPRSAAPGAATAAGDARAGTAVGIDGIDTGGKTGRHGRHRSSCHPGTRFAL